MINTQVTKSKTVLEFGHGDVAITYASRNDGKEVGLFMRNVDSGDIGRKIDNCDFNPNESDVIMTFCSVESIDVHIKMLEAARKKLKKGLKQ